MNECVCNENALYAFFENNRTERQTVHLILRIHGFRGYPLDISTSTPRGCDIMFNL